MGASAPTTMPWQSKWLKLTQLKKDPLFRGGLLVNKLMLMCKLVKLQIKLWKMPQEKWLMMPVSQVVSVEVLRGTL